MRNAMTNGCSPKIDKIQHDLVKLEKRKHDSVVHVKGKLLAKKNKLGQKQGKKVMTTILGRFLSFSMQEAKERAHFLAKLMRHQPSHILALDGRLVVYALNRNKCFGETVRMNHPRLGHVRTLGMVGGTRGT